MSLESNRLADARGSIFATDKIASRDRLRLGAPIHKEAFCRMLLETHDPYRPAVIPWPRPDAGAYARLIRPRFVPFLVKMALIFIR